MKFRYGACQDESMPMYTVYLIGLTASMESRLHLRDRSRLEGHDFVVKEFLQLLSADIVLVHC